MRLSQCYFLFIITALFFAACSKSDLNEEECLSSIAVDPLFISEIIASDYSLIQLKDKRHAIASRTLDYEVELKVFDDDWKAVSNRVFDGQNRSGTIAIRELSDGAFVIILGNVIHSKTLERQLVIIRTTRDGSVISQLELPQVSLKNPYEVRINNKDEILLLGGIGPYSERNLSFLRLSIQGEILSQRTIEQVGSETPSGMILVEGDGLIAMSINSDGSFIGKDSLVVLRLDEEFNSSTRQILGVASYSPSCDALKAFNNEYYVLIHDDELLNNRALELFEISDRCEVIGQGVINQEDKISFRDFYIDGDDVFILGVVICDDQFHNSVYKTTKSGDYIWQENYKIQESWYSRGLLLQGDGFLIHSAVEGELVNNDHVDNISVFEVDFEGVVK